MILSHFFPLHRSRGCYIGSISKMNRSWDPKEWSHRPDVMGCEDPAFHFSATIYEDLLQHVDDCLRVGRVVMVSVVVFIVTCICHAKALVTQ